MGDLMFTENTRWIYKYVCEEHRFGLLPAVAVCMTVMDGIRGETME